MKQEPITGAGPRVRPDDIVPRGWVLLLSMAAFASALSIRAVDPLLPAIGQEFSVSTGAAARVVTAFTVAYGTMQLIGGVLGDRFGKYRLAAIATLLSGAITALSVLAWSLNNLALARLLAGGVAAMIMPMGLAWIGDAVPEDRRQEVLARYIPGQILGVIMGQAVGGILSEWMGWRSVFAVIAGVQIVIGAMMIAALRSRHSPASLESRNGAGMTAALKTLLRLPARWPVRRVLIAGFVEGVAVFGALAFAASHLQLDLGLSAGTAGLIMAGYGIGGLIYSAISARLIGRLGAGATAISGAVLLALAMTGFALTGQPALAAALILLAGLGFYMVHNRLQFSATHMSAESRGAAVAMFASAMFMGQTAGVWLGGRVFDTFGAVPLFAAGGSVAVVLMLWFVLIEDKIIKKR